ncbi:TNF receptor-associated factor 6 [Latimeria chalumnae]|uniref:TNF receptor-associated factor 6 n=1 Tax=Latimeria chalumnae TaxID=7897 RepID=UPI00313B1295
MSLLEMDSSSEVDSCESKCCSSMACANSIGAKEDSMGGCCAGGATAAACFHNSLSEETQGYDVEFDPPLENKYECPICLMALREAVQTPCGHRFCRACITKSLRDAGQKCPVDNEILLESQLFPDNFAKREILSLTVKCPNRGCLLKMELRKLEEHQECCEFSTVECCQCLGRYWRSELEEHMSLHCLRRQVTCENCAATMTYEDKEGHDQNCPLANVTCDYCNTELIREQMPNHCDMDCPKAPVPCTFSTFGCPEKMQRNDLACHLQEFTQVHMRMMAQTLRSMSIAVQMLRETIQQLEGRLVRQDHQIRELSAKMETQSKQMGELRCVIRVLEERTAELEAQQCNGIYIWKIENFSTQLHLQEAERPVVIHSPGFYTGKPGYKLCLRLHLQTPSAPRCANFVSLFVHTMQGEYDSYLPWPFQGTIRLSILDQSEGPMRQNHEEVMEAKPELLAFQRPTSQRNPKGFGYVTFMHLTALKQRTYIKDDTLLVRCEVMTRMDMNCLRREGFQPRSTDGGL